MALAHRREWKAASPGEARTAELEHQRSRFRVTMQVLQLVRQLFARFRAWRYDRRASRDAVIPLFVAPLTLHRDVSSQGVRFYSICGSCGARLDASATLCEECAQGRSPSAPPF